MQDTLTISGILPTIPDPCISVHANVLGITFLQRVEKLLPEVPDWQFRNWGNPSSLGKCLRLTYIGSDPTGQSATDLICQLFGKKETHEVLLDFRAVRWLNNYLDYDIYVTAAKLFKSVLRVYNRKYGTRRRLRIPTKQSLESSLPPGALSHFGWFLERADRRALGVGAWEELYAFIWYLHVHNVRLAPPDFHRLLVLNGFDNDRADDLREFYKHARNLLYMDRSWPGWNCDPPHRSWLGWLERRNS